MTHPDTPTPATPDRPSADGRVEPSEAELAATKAYLDIMSPRAAKWTDEGAKRWLEYGIGVEPSAVRAMVAAALVPGAAAGGAAEWRSIESAPRDGTRVWLYRPECPKDQQQGVGWWHESWSGDDAWWMDPADSEQSEPTYWRPLPTPPGIAAPPPPSAASDAAAENSALLPCDVHLPPATFLRKGVTFGSLMTALRMREGRDEHFTRFGDTSLGVDRNSSVTRSSDAATEGEVEKLLWLAPLMDDFEKACDAYAHRMTQSDACSDAAEEAGYIGSINDARLAMVEGVRAALRRDCDAGVTEAAGLTVERLAERLRKTVAISPDYSLYVVTYILTGMKDPGHERDAALSAILARLTADRGEGA